MVVGVSRPRPAAGANVARSAVGMGVATAASRLIGFGRVLVVAAVLGASALGDAFQGANSFSNVVFELVAAGALSAVLVPTFTNLVDRGDRVEAERLAGGLLWLAVVGLGAVSVVGVAAAPLLARLITAGVPAADVAEQRALVEYLLRWFVPQILLYAFGAIATAALYATRRFAISSLAPIANTVVMVGCLAAFRVAAGPDPGLALGSGERAILGLAGTGGVLAFVAVLVIAARRAGFGLRPRRVARGDAPFRALVGHSVWGVLLHSIAGLLLGAAIVTGATVAGGVVAYQSAFVLFLAPYAILAQPLHSAVLPELAGFAARGAAEEFATATRWSLAAMAKLVLPVGAVVVATATPALSVVQVGALDARGTELVAAALMGLAVGLLPYGAFLLFARASYALGDSRTPALVAIGAGIAGTMVMAVVAAGFDGRARVVGLGIAHSAAYLVGAVALGSILGRRLHGPLVDRDVGRALLAAVAAGSAAWPVARFAADTRLGTAIATAIAGVVGMVAYLAAMRLLGARVALRPRRHE